MFESPTTKQNLKRKIHEICASMTLEILFRVKQNFIENINKWMWMVATDQTFNTIRKNKKTIKSFI